MSIYSKFLKKKKKKKYVKFDSIPKVNKQLIWANFKDKNNLISSLEWCQNCGTKIEDFQLEHQPKAICPKCGYDHSNLTEYPVVLDSNNKKQADNLWTIFTATGTVFRITVNCNDFFAWACADSYDIDEIWFPLMLDLYEKFYWDGIYGLVCWLSGRLPMTEILMNDKRTIQVLLYLRRLTGVTFNPVTRDILTEKRLKWKIKMGNFSDYDLEIGVKKKWLTNSQKEILIKAKENFENSLEEIVREIG